MELEWKNDEIIFPYSKNGFCVNKIKVLGGIYYVAEKDGKRFIRKSLKTVNEIIEEPEPADFLRKNKNEITFSADGSH